MPSGNTEIMVMTTLMTILTTTIMMLMMNFRTVTVRPVFALGEYDDGDYGQCEDS